MENVMFVLTAFGVVIQCDDGADDYNCGIDDGGIFIHSYATKLLGIVPRNIKTRC
jgi:hypothetical protein